MTASDSAALSMAMDASTKVGRRNCIKKKKKKKEKRPLHFKIDIMSKIYNLVYEFVSREDL